MKEGYYWLNLSTINNSPFNGTGYVHVKTINGTPIQKAVGVSSGDIANRVKYDSGWTPWAQVAIKSDLTDALKYNGTFSGDFNNIDISPGIYKINTKYTNAPSQLPAYCVFVQFPVYNLQMIIDGDKIYTRKYVGNPADWTAWRWYNFDGND